VHEILQDVVNDPTLTLLHVSTFFRLSINLISLSINSSFAQFLIHLIFKATFVFPFNVLMYRSNV